MTPIEKECPPCTGDCRQGRECPSGADFTDKIAAFVLVSLATGGAILLILLLLRGLMGVCR